MPTRTASFLKRKSETRSQPLRLSTKTKMAKSTLMKWRLLKWAAEWAEEWAEGNEVKAVVWAEAKKGQVRGKVREGDKDQEAKELVKAKVQAEVVCVAGEIRAAEPQGQRNRNAQVATANSFL